ncbi:MAG TPA: cupin domain-containing protein [Methylomirabilota bacterium]|nr:cupin domain-containing protein [Methylomirabilota bacterium]
MKHALPAPRGFGSVALVVALGLILVAPADGPGAYAGERWLIDNERVTVVEFVFPPGFRGEEHEAPVDEFAYVVEGEFAVVTRGQGKRVVRRGETEWAPRGVVHYSVNEGGKPARVLVVLLKGR